MATARDRAQGWREVGGHHISEAVGQSVRKPISKINKRTKIKNKLPPGMILSPGARKDQLIQEE